MVPRGGGATGASGRAESTPGAELLGHATGLFAVVFLAYSAGAILAWASFGSAVGPAFFYPSAGITVAAMLLTRRALWPAIVAAIIAGEILIDVYFGNPLLVAAGFALANVVEPVLGASLVATRFPTPPDLRQRSQLFTFIGAACLAAPLAGGLIGGTVSARMEGTTWFLEVLHWWSGDGIGVLVVAIPILTWAKQSYVLRARPAETVGVLVLTALLSIAAFWTEAPPSVLVLPILAWAALRLDMVGAALTGAIIAFVANVMTTRGHGMFGSMGMPPASRVALTQVFVAVLVVVALLTAQETSARMRAVREHAVERRERMRLGTLSELAQQLSAALTPQEVGHALEGHILNEAGATALNLGLLSPDGQRLEWITMAGYPPEVVKHYGGGVEMRDATVATDSIRTGRPVLIRTAGDYERTYAEKVRWLRMSGSQTIVGWPLDAGGEAFGALVLAWSRPQPLDTAQLAYISAMATMASQALVRAKIYSDEHARAAVLQAAVLPTAPEDGNGRDLSVTYEPADVAQGLGGDWYDVMRLPKNRSYFAVGDVVGHGLPAVEDMAQLRSAGRAMAHQGLPPAQLLAELNGFTRHASHGKFATMAIAIVDAAAGALSHCCAGHPPPLLRRAADGRVIRLSDGGGPVLGPVEDATYSEGTVRIDRGDVLVMYTDGLVEHSGRGIDFGIARLERIVAGWTADTDLSAECSSLQETLAPRPRSDDICLIAVRLGGDG